MGKKKWLVGLGCVTLLGLSAAGAVGALMMGGAAAGGIAYLTFSGEVDAYEDYASVVVEDQHDYIGEASGVDELEVAAIEPAGEAAVEAEGAADPITSTQTRALTTASESSSSKSSSAVASSEAGSDEAYIVPSHSSAPATDSRSSDSRRGGKSSRSSRNERDEEPEEEEIIELDDVQPVFEPEPERRAAVTPSAEADDIDALLADFEIVDIDEPGGKKSKGSSLSSDDSESDDRRRRR